MLIKKIKYFFLLLTLIGFGWGVSLLCDLGTKKFRAGNITPAFSFDTRWEINEPFSQAPESVLKALNSPFYFVATGGSAYVFRSENDEYVIKFFHADRLIPPKWTSWKICQMLFPETCNRIIALKERQKSLQFLSYKMSLEALKDQTGIVYVHLNPTTSHKNFITIYDNIRIKHQIPTDQTAFVIQKKADRFPPYFKKLLADGKLEEAKSLLLDFASFLKKRADLGIRDGDITPRTNLGMIGNTLVIYDVDQLRVNDIKPTKYEHMMQDSSEMFLWLKKKNPDLITFLKEEIYRLCFLQNPSNDSSEKPEKKIL